MENITNNFILSLYQSGYLNKIIIITIIIAITGVLNKYIKNIFIQTLTETNIKEIFIHLLSVIVEYGLWIISIVLILRVIGFTDFSFILGTAFTAVSSFVLLKLIYGIIDDIIAGILLISLDKVKVGQQIKIRDIKGEIINIGVRKTLIKDKHNTNYLIPNKIIDEEIIEIL